MIKAWLLRSDEYALEKYGAVLDLLHTFPGPIRFQAAEDVAKAEEEELLKKEFEEEKINQQTPVLRIHKSISLMLSLEEVYEQPESYYEVKWNTLFAQCRDFRASREIADEDFVILLTEHSNEYNWFTAGDPKGDRNIFVHTGFWKIFSGSDQRFPVAYHVATGILKRCTFRDYEDLSKHLHEKPIGCINDFCKHKRDVILKLRTADICPVCLDIIQERGVNPHIVKQVLDIIEGVRSQMLFKYRWQQSDQLPRMVLKGYSKNIIFPELGDLRVRLSPQEKSLYLLFLNHPEGIKISELPFHKKELEEIYGKLYTGGDLEAISLHINALTNPSSNSASEKISRIRSKFIDVLGEKMAQHYIIQGTNGGRKKTGLRKLPIGSNAEPCYG
jgi:hypothetical protein